MRLSFIHQVCVYAVFTATAITGYAWLGVHNLLSIQSPFGIQPHPSEAWILAAHGGAAFAFLIVLGTLFPIHIFGGLRARRNVSSGITLLVLVSALIVSGYLLYYAGTPSLRTITWYLHILIGVAIPIILTAHIWIGRRRY